MTGSNHHARRAILGLFGLITLFLWGAVIFNFSGTDSTGSIIPSIIIGTYISIGGFVSSRGYGWNLLTNISRKLGYDTIFAPGDKITIHWAISRLFYLNLFAIIILLMADRSIISSQIWLVALTTGATIVSVEVLSEFVFSNDDRAIEIGAPYSSTYIGVSRIPRTLSQIQESADGDFVPESIEDHLDSLENWGHIESKEISGQKIWWKK